MSSDHMDVITSLSAEEIRAYCRTLAQELELTLEDVWWGHDLAPDDPDAPYHLVLSVTKPFIANPQFWFTRKEVLGYATGETKAVIRGKIHKDLETHLRTWRSHQ